MVKSEHGSPAQCSTTNLEYGCLQPLVLSHATTAEQPLYSFSADLNSASIDWSHYDDLAFNHHVDKCAPLLASGEMSEVRERGSLDVIRATRPDILGNKSGSDFNTSEFGGEVDTYLLSTASSDVPISKGQILVRNSTDNFERNGFL
jgi:hypothetical protein